MKDTFMVLAVIAGFLFASVPGWLAVHIARYGRRPLENALPVLAGLAAALFSAPAGGVPWWAAVSGFTAGAVTHAAFLFLLKNNNNL